MEMSGSEREIGVVCGVLVDDEGRYLACLRPAGKHLAGFWEFPGGKIDFGETAEQALARELKEELGVDVEVGSGLEPVEWNDGGVFIRLMPYFCKVSGGVPKALEHEEVRWIGVGEFDGLKWAPADVPILDGLVLNHFNPPFC